MLSLKSHASIHCIEKWKSFLLMKFLWQDIHQITKIKKENGYRISVSIYSRSTFWAWKEFVKFIFPFCYLISKFKVFLIHHAWIFGFNAFFCSGNFRKINHTSGRNLRKKVISRYQFSTRSDSRLLNVAHRSQQFDYLPIKRFHNRLSV